MKMFGREGLELFEGVKRFEGAALLQKRVSGSVQQLQGLEGELDFANSAVSKRSGETVLGKMNGCKCWLNS